LRDVRAEVVRYEETLHEQASTAPQELAQKIATEVEQLRLLENDLGRSVETQDAEVKDLEGRARGCSWIEREKEKAVSGLRLQSKETRKQLMATEMLLADLASKAQALRDMRTDILRQSVLENIKVPVLGAGTEALQDFVEEPRQAASMPTQKPSAEEPSQAASTPTQKPSAEEPSQAASMPTQTLLAGQSSADIAIDFSSLPDEKQSASVGPAAKMLEEEYLSELERLRVEMERLGPNLKAVDQMQSTAENFEAASHEADAARREIEDVESQFEAVRKARKEQFMNCFKTVSDEIGDVYRRLTANTAGLQADGGSCFLDLEDTEDPFNGGIKFVAMPPAKRFREMHLLSGGEKTLAAMALLFAVHAYQRPPFMVLDEVDAALDANNVRALAAYTEQAECQTIVISLKDRFYVRGEALVGVWKNKPQETSAILTLDLTRYSPSAQPV